MKPVLDLGLRISSATGDDQKGLFLYQLLSATHASPVSFVESWEPA